MYNLKGKRFVRGVFPERTKEVKQRNQKFSVGQLLWLRDMMS